jgi:tRNA modification GTPase
VLTRCDRVEVSGMCDTRSSSGIIATSSVTGAGLASLTTAIATAVSRLPPRASPATVRLADGLDTAAAAMAAAGEMMARDVAAGSLDEALLAGHLRAAAESLGEVTGVELGPDLLDRVFARHCIGK